MAAKQCITTYLIFGVVVQNGLCQFKYVHVTVILVALSWTNNFMWRFPLLFTFAFISQSRSMDSRSCRQGPYFYSIHLDSELAEVFLIPHILVCVLGLLQRKHLFIHHRLDPIRINRPVHLFKLESAPHQKTSDRALIE